MRTGRCRRCGLCCLAVDRFQYRVKEMILPGEPDYETVEPLPMLPEGRGAGPCEKLVYDIRSREAVCLLHGEYKPALCRRYPLSMVDRLPECGFIFKEER